MRRFYADEIVIPVELPHFGGYEDDLLARLGVAATICLALELRPLIEEGIVKLELPLFGFCKECGLAHRKREREVLRKARQLYEKEIDRFSLRYTPATAERHGFVEMMGPPEYLEHGLIIWEYLKEPAWGTEETHQAAPSHALKNRGAQIEVGSKGSSMALRTTWWISNFGVWGST